MGRQMNSDAIRKPFDLVSYLRAKAAARKTTAKLPLVSRETLGCGCSPKGQEPVDRFIVIGGFWSHQECGKSIGVPFENPTLPICPQKGRRTTPRSRLAYPMDQPESGV